MNPRNFLVLIGLFIVLIVGFVLVGNLLNALIPLIVTAIIAFILGRASVHMNLLDFIRSARAGRAAVQQSGILKTAETLIEKAVPTAKTSTPAATVKPAVSAKPAPPVEVEAELPQRKINPDLLLDPNFEIKTSEQVEAEARLAEQEATKRAASTDVSAALEERRKRLLGNKGS